MLILTRRPGEQMLIGPIGQPILSVELRSINRDRESALLDLRIPQMGEGPMFLRQDQSSVIAAGVHSITIRFFGCNRGNQARIGIEAPKDIQVHRSEIAARIAREQTEASARQRDAAFSRKLASAMS